MPKFIKYVALSMYADDTKMYASAKRGDEIKGLPTQPKINLFEICFCNCI